MGFLKIQFLRKVSETKQQTSKNFKICQFVCLKKKKSHYYSLRFLRKRRLKTECYSYIIRFISQTFELPGFKIGFWHFYSLLGILSSKKNRFSHFESIQKGLFCPGTLNIHTRQSILKNERKLAKLLTVEVEEDAR